MIYNARMQQAELMSSIFLWVTNSMEPSSSIPIGTLWPQMAPFLSCISRKLPRNLEPSTFYRLWVLKHKCASSKIILQDLSTTTSISTDFLLQNTKNSKNLKKYPKNEIMLCRTQNWRTSETLTIMTETRKKNFFHIQPVTFSYICTK